jgi:hypothetical protein
MQNKTEKAGIKEARQSKSLLRIIWSTVEVRVSVLLSKLDELDESIIV